MQFTVWKAGRNLEETRAISSKDRLEHGSRHEEGEEEEEDEEEEEEEEEEAGSDDDDDIDPQDRRPVPDDDAGHGGALHQVQTLRDGTMKAENELDMVTENRIDKMG